MRFRIQVLTNHITVFYYTFSNTGPGPPRGWEGGGLRANTKSGTPQNGFCEGTPLGNFEILHALKCVLGAPEAPFHAHSTYIPASCRVRLAVSDQKV